MLVYLKEPMGCSDVSGRRVYGRFYAYGSFGPTQIPRSVYFKNRDVLEEAQVTGEWLSERSGKIFPPVSFKTTELYLLDFNMLIQIAGLLGIKYIRSRKPSTNEKKALGRSVVARIEEL